MKFFKCHSQKLKDDKAPMFLRDLPLSILFLQIQQSLSETMLLTALASAMSIFLSLSVL